MASYKTVKGNICDDKGTWVVRARVYDPISHNYKQRAKTTGYKVKDNTKRKAEQMMRDILFQWEQEANAEVFTSDPLFSVYIEKWLSKKSFSLKESSTNSYRYYIDKHILPYFAHVKVREITMQALQHYYSLILKEQKVKTVKKHHIIISGALKEAVIDEIIPSSPATYIDFPSEPKYEGAAYTSEQAMELLSVIDDEPLKPAIILGLYYGLRRSEVCGLR